MEIHATVFDLLCQETIGVFLRTSKSYDVNADNNDEDDFAIREAYEKVKTIGYSVGVALSERWTFDRNNRLQDQLDVIKLICKEFWTNLYRKQIDNLKTNHRGVFVLQDTSFKPLRSCSVGGITSGSDPKFSLFVAYPCGLIQGALASFGYMANVSAELHSPPAVNFKIEIVNPVAAPSQPSSVQPLPR